MDAIAITDSAHDNPNILHFLYHYGCEHCKDWVVKAVQGLKYKRNVNRYSKLPISRAKQ